MAQLGVTLGDKLSADVQPEGLMLRPARQAYALADLLAQCDAKAPAPADWAEWGAIRPAGNEVW